MKIQVGIKFISFQANESIKWPFSCNSRTITHWFIKWIFSLIKLIYEQFVQAMRCDTVNISDWWINSSNISLIGKRWFIFVAFWYCTLVRSQVKYEYDCKSSQTHKDTNDGLCSSDIRLVWQIEYTKIWCLR